ncbi:MAG TPA: Asp-tRNA(Asn)/Glu-tRNA(Gln) amidotransferase subunit GatB [Methylomirabilota bacterium]|nr:Asp-tRNA(Asn)/Glu-tRNA(Gln) amidotransferase subunit GatB [Methylomirabilota bacterium]
MSDYETVIGLEVHAQLLTRSKMFCGCAATFGAAPNRQTCPVCQGMPGVLPVINRRAIEFGIRTALALHCHVNPECRFARKHYFYPDMPKNYQISQYEEPLAEDGWLELDVDGGGRRVGIQRLHLEEDVGKLTHEGGVFETATSSLVDYNRSGVPLMEIVSRPDLRSPAEAAEYLRLLRAVLRYLGVCDGNMEEGSLRCDANISLRPRGAHDLGTKVEIKNMNSFRHVRAALEYEVERQTRALRSGERLVQETRLWNPDKGHTLSMRSKEFAHDYRYFPEPDLVPLRPDPAWVAEVAAGLPELPRARRLRFVEQYGLPPYDAEILTADRSLADYYEEAVRLHPNPKALANWIMSELLRELHGDPATIAAARIRPAHLARLVALVDDATISGKIAKDVFERMARSGEDPDTIVRREGLTQVADEAALAAVVARVIAENPAAAADYRKGRKQSLAFLVGQVMKATQGKASPQVVNRLLAERLPPAP